jgi:hypothetical protein
MQKPVLEAERLAQGVKRLGWMWNRWAVAPALVRRDKNACDCSPREPRRSRRWKRTSRAGAILRWNDASLFEWRAESQPSGPVLFIQRIELVGQPFQVSGKNSRSVTGFVTYLWNHDLVYICNGVANFRLYALEQIFQAAAESLILIGV